MSVLSRRLDESIVLPDRAARITILSIHGGHVRLGISAPRLVDVYRQEVWERIDREASTAITCVEPSAPVVPK